MVIDVIVVGLFFTPIFSPIFLIINMIALCFMILFLDAKGGKDEN